MLRRLANNIPTPFASLWLADIRISLDDSALPGWLNSKELARYQAFFRPLRRQQFLLARIVLKLILEEEFGIPPSETSLDFSPSSPPCLVFSDTSTLSPGFSVAHSGNWVACAVHREKAVGVDIECMRSGRNLAEISRYAFTPDEYLWMQKQPETERESAFYRIWTKKEALYKLESVQKSHQSHSFFHLCTRQADCQWFCQLLPETGLAIALCQDKFSG